MKKTDSKSVGNAQLRSFGLAVGAVFGLIAVYPLFKGAELRAWASLISIALIAPAIIFPPLLLLPFRLWTFIGEILGWLNTRIILTGLYFLALLPVSLIMKISRKDPLKRKIDRKAESYREKPECGNEKDLKNQF
jgi:hypothetical protein